MLTVWAIEDREGEERCSFTTQAAAEAAVAYFDAENDSVRAYVVYETVEELLDFWREKGLGHSLDTRPIA